jgi:hypothetical protein
MGLSVVYCPDCGEGFYDRGGVAASVLWSRHFAAAHTKGNPNG